MAGARAAHALPRQPRALQLALVHALGTGEIGDNGTQEIDVARWALGVDYPTRVVSSGGRYHFDDDWQFTDTQDVGFEFAGGRQIVWQGRSCNGFPIEGRGRGTSIHGIEGTAVMDRRGYVVHDTKKAIRTGVPLNAPILEGHKSTLLAQLGNIAQRTGRALRTDPADGRILDDAAAMTRWQREYAPGWMPVA